MAKYGGATFGGYKTAKSKREAAERKRKKKAAMELARRTGRKPAPKKKKKKSTGQKLSDQSKTAQNIRSVFGQGRDKDRPTVKPTNKVVAKHVLNTDSVRPAKKKKYAKPTRDMHPPKKKTYPDTVKPHKDRKYPDPSRPHRDPPKDLPPAGQDPKSRPSSTPKSKPKPKKKRPSMLMKQGERRVKKNRYGQARLGAQSR